MSEFDWEEGDLIVTTWQNEVLISDNFDDGNTRISFADMDRLCDEWLQWRHDLTPGSGKCIVVRAKGPIPRAKPRFIIDHWEGDGE
jgi:hypothetical protein